MKGSRRDLFSAILLLGALTLVSLWPLPIHPDRMVMPAQGEFSDLAISHWPMQGWMRESVLEYGEWPFWHPLYFSGQTLAGNLLSGFFYPPNWLHFLLPSAAAFAVLILLHVWLAGVGMFVVMRYGAEVSFAGALASAILFAFGQRLGSHLSAGHISLWYAWSLFPWVVFCTLRASTRTRYWGAGILLGVTFLADARVGYYALLAVCVILVWRLVATVAPAHDASGKGFPRRVLQSLAASFVPTLLAFAGTAAVLILPWLELLGRTTRVDLSPAEATVYSLPPAALVGTLLPFRPATHEWAVYLGIPACALLLLSAWSRRRKFSRALWIGAGIALVLALGTYTPLYRMLLAVLPGMKFLRVPARIWMLALVCLSALAGLGVDTLLLMAREARQRAMLAVLALLVVGAILCGAAALMGLRDVDLYLHMGFLGVTVLILVALVLWGKVPVRGAIIITLALLFADQVMSARAWWRLATMEQLVAPGREVAEYLAALPDVGRVYSPSYSLPQQTAWFYRLETSHGVDPTQLRRYGRFMTAAGGYGDEGYSVAIPPFPADEPLATALADSGPSASLLGMLNVTHLVAEFPVISEDWKLATRIGSSFVYENARTLPRAWLVHAVTVVSGGEDAVLDVVTSSDLAREVAVEKPLPGPVHSSSESADDIVRILGRTPNSLQIETRVDAPGVLVLSEVWYPGWRAYVDGEPVPVLQVDYLLRGVYIATAGSHIVRMEYVPVLVYIGAAISAATVLAFAVMVWVGGRH